MLHIGWYFPLLIDDTSTVGSPSPLECLVKTSFHTNSLRVVHRSKQIVTSASSFTESYYPVGKNPIIFILMPFIMVGKWYEGLAITLIHSYHFHSLLPKLQVLVYIIKAIPESVPDVNMRETWPRRNKDVTSISICLEENIRITAHKGSSSWRHGLLNSPDDDA